VSFSLPVPPAKAIRLFRRSVTRNANVSMLTIYRHPIQLAGEAKAHCARQRRMK